MQNVWVSTNELHGMLTAKKQFEETEKVSKPHSDKSEKLELLDQKFKRIIIKPRVLWFGGLNASLLTQSLPV